jgi:hypothetical protein
LSYAPIWDEDCGCGGCLGEGCACKEREEGVESLGEHVVDVEQGSVVGVL